MNAEQVIRQALFDAQDAKYRSFTAKLIPTIDAETIIGVRAPAINRLVKEWKGRAEREDFYARLPHRYLEENNLHGALISEEKDLSRVYALLEAFLPFVDNWATCDTVRPAAFRRHPADLPERCFDWMDSERPYTVRFGIEMLMTYYLDDAFQIEHARRVAAVRSQEYYVNMMIAWYFATALAKQYDAVIPFLEENRLERWTHNKTIQKAVESFRVSDERKAYLKTLRKK